MVEDEAGSPTENIGKSGGKIGFYATIAVTKPSAYTQTYSTPDKTISNPTATAPGDLGATQSGSAWGASSEANFDKIGTALDALVADNLDLRKAVTALIDDLQALGLVG